MNFENMKNEINRLSYEYFTMLKCSSLEIGSANFEIPILIEKDGEFIEPEIELIPGKGIVIK